MIRTVETHRRDGWRALLRPLKTCSTRVFVSNNSAEIGVDEDTGLPYLRNQEGMGEANIPASTQSIISITPGSGGSSSHK
ncbi:unnamed protein product [Hyaloperonospora brassicae]|uniref:RxLR effector candidate protein n=1 Tax=Hyaloperonospora brassicae TaxID=162125 RepID=A0AAV0TW58_HYABA|nr:unnamed protein product [Hyaloperonospora brassicae]